jgi:hypothetical protein
MWRKREIGKMMTKNEALRLALEALEYMDVTAERYVDKQIPEKAITAIKAALEAKDEPVAWIWEKEDGYTSIETHSLSDEDMKNVGVKSMKPLYAKPQFIGLSEDEIVLISADCAATHQHTDIHFARAIEAKLNGEEHMTEPVAFFNPHKGFYWAKPTNFIPPVPVTVDVEPLALYTQRTWVGLTDEEMQSIAFESADALSAVFVAEAKLRSKND